MTPSDAELVAAAAAFMGWHERYLPEGAAWVDEHDMIQSAVVGYRDNRNNYHDQFNPLTRPADCWLLLGRLEELEIQHTIYFEPDMSQMHSLGIWDSDNNQGISSGWCGSRSRAVCLAIYQFQQAQK